jgi:hypothetical protein
MDKELIQQQLTDWLVNFIEKPNPMLNGWAPCPYARRARVSGKFDIKFATIDDLLLTIEQAAAELAEREVVAVCIDRNTISADKLEELVAEQNHKLMAVDVVLLEDHPDAVEIVNGVHMNFGNCAIVFVQSLSKLNEASQQLQQSNYYHCWSKENLDTVVSWRVNSEHDILPHKSQ